MVYNYKSSFDETRQDLMRNFFLDLSTKGTNKSFKRGNYIDIPSGTTFGIVVDGRVKESIYGQNGEEKILYILQPGEIFGEITYFGKGEDYLNTVCLENCRVSFIEKEYLESMLVNDPEGYSFVFHSIIRKFRILMYQMSNMTFNTAVEQLADTLYRLKTQQGKNRSGEWEIAIHLTHQQLANLIGCSRVTVTRGLNDFCKEGIIEIKKKKIIIKDLDRLNDIRNSHENNPPQV
ncbi:Crp/Fnr family transcriptional regulator [Natranaerobius trueperi]|uniref:Crp/Fnr family transcriptional regulator n=1 Tax=Natranaerobius trueperi TaxID=759412 RepID=A0A226C2J6_9FIRM|nr:Crp/Fnr family transcriptional regulator [Natranaerobius trueperi]OWZ84659.1 hypothetical protein CDO51_02545 [Natranaerobius trueperi]